MKVFSMRISISYIVKISIASKVSFVKVVLNVVEIILSRAILGLTVSMVLVKSMVDMNDGGDKGSLIEQIVNELLIMVRDMALVMVSTMMGTMQETEIYAVGEVVMMVTILVKPKADKASLDMLDSLKKD